MDVFKEVCKHPKLSRQPANNPGPSGIFIVASALCIVADSNPEAEYEETLAKAAGFLAALEVAERRLEISPAQRAGIIVPK